MKLTIINGNAEDHALCADLLFTDPPFDMPGKQLAKILNQYNSNHLVLITSMSQLLEFNNYSDFIFSFDFVLDHVAPKKSNSFHKPHYTHSNVVYMRRHGVSSIFDRRTRRRSDVFSSESYWPTIVRAPKERSQFHGMAKNINAFTDILGSFNARNIVDPFGGSGTSIFAAFELGINCTMIEISSKHCESVYKVIKFLGAEVTMTAKNDFSPYPKFFWH